MIKQTAYFVWSYKIQDLLAVVVAELAERSLPIPKDCSSNRGISIFLKNIYSLSDREWPTFLKDSKLGYLNIQRGSDDRTDSGQRRQPDVHFEQNFRRPEMF